MGARDAAVLPRHRLPRSTTGTYQLAQNDPKATLVETHEVSVID
jgi:hypothetical protein